MIVEDEPHAMLLLQDYIRKVPYLELLGSFYDAMAALEFLHNHQPDVIFLDINMPGISGIEMAALLPREQKIIFTTAYSEFALDSFDYHAVDYLLKPISFKRFIKAIEKLQVYVTKSVTDISPSKETESQDFLFVKSGKQIHRIAYTSILYLEAVKEYIAIHTEKEKILVYKRMKDVAAVLPDAFVRIHNSYIINTSHITQIHSGQVHLHQIVLPVSSGYRSLFQAKISSRLW
jgi:two-component system, LytTR family, response regulator